MVPSSHKKNFPPVSVSTTVKKHTASKVRLSGKKANCLASALKGRKALSATAVSLLTGIVFKNLAIHAQPSLRPCRTQEHAFGQIYEFTFFANAAMPRDWGQ
uniref:Uncharacterized protein n=1 Tax=Quercus lobata TaxID=97700 RepID=A0A7N2N876_QUELO